MSKIYKGSINVLKKCLKSAGIFGDWSEENRSGKQIFRSESGGILNWWPSKGTVNFQGKDSGIRELERAFSQLEQRNGVRPKVKATAIRNEAVERPAVKPKEKPIDPGAATQGRRIFVVHGYDTDASQQLELMLRCLGITDLQMFDSGSNLNAIFDAFEGVSRSNDFGLVLMTSDDVGSRGKNDVTSERLLPRANQSVILKTGIMLSALTRNRVALIVEGSTNIPSELKCLMRMNYNDSIIEIVPRLRCRLKEENFEINACATSALTDG